jgi:hypothetical protein
MNNATGGTGSPFRGHITADQSRAFSVASHFAPTSLSARSDPDLCFKTMYVFNADQHHMDILLTKTTKL